MLNVVRSPIHDSRLSIQYDDVDHVPRRCVQICFLFFVLQNIDVIRYTINQSVSLFTCRPRQNNERTCGCLFQRELKIAREKERIKQFSIWFAEVDKFKQEEYIKRRRKWRKERVHRNQKMWKIRLLLVPASVLLVTGAFLIIASNVRFLGLGDWFYVNRGVLTAVGGVSTGLSVVVFMIEQGLQSYYANKTGIKLFAQIGRTHNQPSNISVAEKGHSKNTFIPHKNPVPKENKDTCIKQLHHMDSIDTNGTDDATECVSEEDPLVPKIPKKRPPKLSEIADRRKEIKILKSVDTTASALTEVTLVSNSDRSSCSEPPELLADAAVGGVSEDEADFMAMDVDKDTVTLQSSGSGDMLLG